jgi:hypothetical protein
MKFEMELGASVRLTHDTTSANPGKQAIQEGCAAVGGPALFFSLLHPWTGCLDAHFERGSW